MIESSDFATNRSLDQFTKACYPKENSDSFTHQQTTDLLSFVNNLEDCHFDFLLFLCDRALKTDLVCYLIEVFVFICHVDVGMQKYFGCEMFYAWTALVGESRYFLHFCDTRLSSSFLNFLHSVFLMAGCLFGLVGRMEDIGKFS